jgi:hypothetical protein
VGILEKLVGNGGVCGPSIKPRSQDRGYLPRNVAQPTIAFPQQGHSHMTVDTCQDWWTGRSRLSLRNKATVTIPWISLRTASVTHCVSPRNKTTAGQPWMHRTLRPCRSRYCPRNKTTVTRPWIRRANHPGSGCAVVAAIRPRSQNRGCIVPSRIVCGCHSHL